MSKVVTGTYSKYGVTYDTVTLTDGEYALTITPEKGGMASSFKKGEEEYLWLRDGNFESTDRTRCGVPILFPSCGMPNNGVHVFNGKNYPTEVHGFADLLPWTLDHATDDEVVVTLKPNGLTKFVYPFDFKLTMKYTLCGKTAGLDLTVENTGKETLPFSVGFHPYFAISELDNVTFDIKAKTFSDHADGEQPACTGEVTLPHNPGSDANTRFLTGVESPMVLKDSGNGHVVTVGFGEGFGNAILWEQEAEKFACMEPWNGWANSVNEPGKHEELPVGETKTFSWTITIE